MLIFRYTAIVVADVSSTVSFYERAFGLRLRYMHPSQGYAEMETGETLLAFTSDVFVAQTTLFGAAEYARNCAGTPAAGVHLAFVTADLAADLARAIAAGAEQIAAPIARPWGQTAAYVRDCNGIIVELCTRSPRDTT